MVTETRGDVLSSMECAVGYGVRLLDEEVPDWRERVDPETLDMSSYEHCMLGQLYENDMGLGVQSLDIAAPASYGFDLPTSAAWWLDSVADAATLQISFWRTLTDLWVEELNSRSV